jgi:hypothetical protein
VGQSPTPLIPTLIPIRIRTHTTLIGYRNTRMTARRMGMGTKMDILPLMLASILPSGHTNTYAIVSLISVNLLSLMPMPNPNLFPNDTSRPQSSVKFSLFNLFVSTCERS